MYLAFLDMNPVILDACNTTLSDKDKKLLEMTAHNGIWSATFSLVKGNKLCWLWLNKDVNDGIKNNFRSI